MRARGSKNAKRALGEASRTLCLVDNKGAPTPCLDICSRPRRRKMNDWQKSTRADYEQKGFAARSGYGRNPVLLIVDFINAFTDPKTPLGGDFAWEINATRQLQDAFRRGRLPIVYTTIAYSEDLRDAGTFVKKVTSSRIV